MRLRTHYVDVNSKGLRCKERKSTTLARLPGAAAQHAALLLRPGGPGGQDGQGGGGGGGGYAQQQYADTASLERLFSAGLAQQPGGGLAELYAEYVLPAMAGGAVGALRRGGAARPSGCGAGAADPPPSEAAAAAAAAAPPAAPQHGDAEEEEDGCAFACRVCGTPLFEGRDVVGHAVEAAATTGEGGKERRFAHKKWGEQQAAAEQCTSFFLGEAPPWVGGLEGKIACPTCSARLGTFSWGGAQCSCGFWVVPCVQFQKSKVEARASVGAEAAAVAAEGAGGVCAGEAAAQTAGTAGEGPSPIPTDADATPPLSQLLSEGSIEHFPSVIALAYARAFAASARPGTQELLSHGVVLTTPRGACAGASKVLDALLLSRARMAAELTVGEPTVVSTSSAEVRLSFVNKQGATVVVADVVTVQRRLIASIVRRTL